MSKEILYALHYPAKPGSFYRLTDGSFKRVFPDGSIRSCDASGNPLPKQRMNKKRKRALKRAAALGLPSLPAKQNQ